MLQKENLHHAHLFEGRKENIIAKLHVFFEHVLEIAIHGNPDYSYLEFDSIGVDDARTISFMQQKRPTAGERKIFVIVFNSITREAQNALLKVFEEPTVGTHFFLVTHSRAQLLPTLMSRLYIHGALHEEQSINTSEASTFLKATPAARLKMVKKIIDSDTPKIEALGFVSDLERYIQQTGTVASFGTTLDEIYKIKSYLNDTSASVKMLLEHLSIVVPQV